MKKLFAVSLFDFSLIFGDCWLYAYEHEFRKQLSFRFPDILYFGSAAGVVILRPEKDQRAFEQYITANLKKSKNWLPSLIKKYNGLFDELDEFLKHARNRNDYLEQLFLVSAKILPIYVVVYWIYHNKFIFNNLPKGLELGLKKARIRSEGYYTRVDKVFSKIFVKRFPNRQKYFRVTRFTELKISKLPNMMAKRLDNFLVYKNHLLVGKLSLPTSVEKFGFEYEDLNLKANQVYGLVGFKGKVIGKVRIIQGKGELRKLKKGEVMITPMTSPDFIQGIKKTAAVVTDFGGIMCHAAIACRELKKVCIVGTKVATKVFKTGDLVEVDANKGIVRKIK